MGTPLINMPSKSLIGAIIEISVPPFYGPYTHIHLWTPTPVIININIKHTTSSGLEHRIIRYC